jgi:hypothetical protein
MARLPRLVLPGLPHHVTQRGSGRCRTFFEEADHALYLDLLAQDAVRVAPALERVGDFAAFLAEDIDEAAAYLPLRRAESIGRPIGGPAWLATLEERTGRRLAPGKRGPKKGLSKLSP